MVSPHGWTAADLAPCVICQKGAVLRSPRGVACHFSCAQEWEKAHVS